MVDVIISFIRGNMFMIEMLPIIFIISFSLPKRRMFPLRVAVSVVVALVVGYYTPSLMNAIIAYSGANVVRQILSYFFQFACIISVLLACFELSVPKALFVGAIGYFIQHINYCTDCLIEYSRIFPIELYVLCQLFRFLKLIVFTVVIYIVFFRRIMGRNFPDKVNPVRLVMIVMMIFAVCIVLNLLSEVRHERSVSFSIADLCCNFIGLCYCYSVLNLSVADEMNEKIQKLLQKNAEQYRFSKENIEQLNIKCHDLKHQISVFRENGGLNQDALGELERIVDGYNDIFHTDNVALDVLLTEKSFQCRQKNIRLTCIADGRGLSYMKSYDIYALFGNAIENAMEAADEFDDEEKRFVSILLKKVNSFYSVQIKNCVKRETVIGANGLPATHKSDKENHGFGMRSMVLLAEKYGGEISFKAEEGIFCLNMMLPYITEAISEKT